jgi:hypothetical protein
MGDSATHSPVEHRWRRVSMSHTILSPLVLIAGAVLLVVVVGVIVAIAVVLTTTKRK